MLRHLVLNSVRAWNKMHRADYGKMIIAADSSSWRKEVFPYYKGKRAIHKIKSPINWTKVHSFLDVIYRDLERDFPYVCIREDRCEADDIIGVVVKWYHENTDEPILILSGDKDFKQLHFSDRVRQYSPVQKRYLGTIDREREKTQLILCGDTGDGVPNILSADHVLVTDGVRQSKMTSKRLAHYLSINLEDPDCNDQYRNWKRNQLLIDLDHTPENLQEQILSTLQDQLSNPTKSNVFNYLINHQLKQLMENVSDF